MSVASRQAVLKNTRSSKKTILVFWRRHKMSFIKRLPSRHTPQL